MLERARGYFSVHDVLAVDTPALSPSAGTDPNIESLRVESHEGSRYFLHTSPEFCMKRLLAAGYPDVYSICRVFRDGEAGKGHAPEFTMIEWYRRNFDLDAIIADAIAFIACVLDAPALSKTVECLDYRDAFLRYADIDIFAASSDALANRLNAGSDLRKTLGEQRSDWLDLLLATWIAPKFNRDTLTVLRHYPADQAALARLCPLDDRVADRFEIFAGAIELANGFVELTDAAEQRRRFEADVARRRDSGKPVHPVDERFLSALDSGLPACAGVAIGFERLQMIHDRTEDIRDVMTFGFH